MANNETMIVGCGYVGRRVAALEHAQGNTVICLSRTEHTCNGLRNLGYRVVAADLDVPASIDIQGSSPDILYYFAPPPNSGTTDPRLGAFLERIASQRAPERLVYISTSGVYGNCDGNWVDESHPANPQSDRAVRRWSAEQNVQAWCAERGVRAVILRVPGIYGPGRLPVDRLRQGLPVVRREQSPFSNRIHVDDLAAICVAAGHVPSACDVYNVSDGQPTTMTDYFLKAADALDLPHPPEISMAEARERFSPAMLSFLEESRRLDNRKMLVELGIQLRYGELERGLTASIRADAAPRGTT
ncbi:SDR family oxidoreductase [Methylotetracoccus oryzae]|uniref:SDR family oxidoreductase n=1 Tax=Methylotetracoccus oryzae TaxID=1919059 RepID=UPI00111834C0|nr:SDR family oxidoreductase [Methylotetracoccus oryzae]